MKTNKHLEEIIEVLRENRNEFRRKYGIIKIGIFGSVVTGKADSASDLDLLVEFDRDVEMDLLKFIEVERHLSELLGRKVDLVEKAVLKPFIGEHILREVVYP